MNTLREEESRRLGRDGPFLGGGYDMHDTMTLWNPNKNIFTAELRAKLNWRLWRYPARPVVDHLQNDASDIHIGGRFENRRVREADATGQR